MSHLLLLPDFAGPVLDFVMPLSSCSLKVAFAPQINQLGRQRSFAFSVAAELALFAPCKNRSNSIAIPRLPRSRGASGFPKMLKLLWLKAPFARILARCIIILLDFVGGLAGFERGIEDAERAWFAR